MAYVNQDPNAPPPPPPRYMLVWPSWAQLARIYAQTRLRLGCAIILAALLVGLVALLALAPPYAGLAAGVDWQFSRLIAPLHTYLFRNAVLNTGLLLLGIYLVALPLGVTWAITGIPPWARPFLLLPIFMPGALVGLLWRPLLSGWLDLANLQLSLLATGLVLAWQAVPLAAWLFSFDRDAWPRLIPLCALLVLLDGTLVVTLTRGEPFNAAQTWSSWLVQQLWVGRAWGYAAGMGGALAVVVAGMVWWASQRSRTPIYIPHGSPLGLTVLIVWVFGPLIMPLIAFGQAPMSAVEMLVRLGGVRWLVNGLFLWGVATVFARGLAWQLSTPRARRVARTLTAAFLPIALVALAYLADLLPILRGLWLLALITSLFAAGLVMGEMGVYLSPRQRWQQAAGYAALVIAATFPLQLVLQLPARAWTPALGVVWTLAEAPDGAAAMGLALLLTGAWAAIGAWLIRAVRSTTQVR